MTTMVSSILLLCLCHDSFFRYDLKDGEDLKMTAAISLGIPVAVLILMSLGISGVFS